MKMRELMERSGMQETGRAVAYVKDALRELNMLSETHVQNEKFAITKDQRYYNIPNEIDKMVAIKVKNHLNSKDEYRRIPRLLYEPMITDSEDEI